MFPQRGLQSLYNIVLHWAKGDIQTLELLYIGFELTLITEDLNYHHVHLISVDALRIQLRKGVLAQWVHTLTL